MSRNFTITKTTPNDIMFILHPFSNPGQKKLIHLTNRMPKVALPEDWTNGIFFDQEIYNMFRNGLFTFNDNDAAVKAAFEAGAYFDEIVDFTPAKVDDIKTIEDLLESGVQTKILAAIKTYGKDRVREVAEKKADSFNVSTVKTLEKILGVQLIMTEE